MGESIAFFDAEHGIGLRIDAGSGRSWMDTPDGDPRHAHCRLDAPADTLVPTIGPAPRLSSGTLFLPWADLLSLADRLTGLATGDRAGTVTAGDRFTSLRVRLRRDGRAQATAVFTQAHHVTTTVRCTTLWDRHFGVRDDLPALAGQIRTAVGRLRPAR